MGSNVAQARLNLPVEPFGLDDSRTYYLSDLITGEYYEVSSGSLQEFTLPVKPYTTTMLVLDEEIFTDVPEPPGEDGPVRPELYQNFPNPFNPATNIRFYLPEQRAVVVGVYNVVGQRVAQLKDEIMPQGEHTVVWDATDMPSGIYIIHLEIGNQVLTRKMTLIK
jgi:hypothetical protein